MRRQAAKQLAKVWGGALETATVLREFLKRWRPKHGTLQSGPEQSGTVQSGPYLKFSTNIILAVVAVHVNVKQRGLVRRNGEGA